MPEDQDRKPTPQPTREQAQIVLNKFLKENNILLGTERPKIDWTGSGGMIIESPRIVAVYGDEVSPPKQPGVN